MVYNSSQADAAPKRCLYISSYHQGYSWNDDIERGVRKTLHDRCQLTQFNLDTKRNPSAHYAETKALEAKHLIEQWKPDIVIVSDDNAIKYVLQTHYKNSTIPFVFCGPNWTVQEYGLPYKNTAGMIEVNAITPLLSEVKSIIRGADKGACLAANNETDRKICGRFRAQGNRMGIEIGEHFVKNANDWKLSYRALMASDIDFLIVPTNAGIENWDNQVMKDFVRPETRKLTVSVYDFAAPFVMLTYATLGEEQGEYAAETALKIVAGAKPSDFPQLTNRRWKTQISEILIDKVGLKLSENLVRNAEKVDTK